MTASPAIRAYHDSKGWRRVDASQVHPLIASYLEQDVQGSVRECDEVIRLASTVAQGGADLWRETGNAHTITLRADRVTIENECDDSLGVADMPTALFIEYVSIWRDFLLNSKDERAS